MSWCTEDYIMILWIHFLLLIFFLINGGMFCDTKNGFPVKILSFVAVANQCSCGCAAWGRSE